MYSCVRVLVHVLVDYTAKTHVEQELRRLVCVSVNQVQDVGLTALDPDPEADPRIRISIKMKRIRYTAGLITSLALDL